MFMTKCEDQTQQTSTHVQRQQWKQEICVIHEICSKLIIKTLEQCWCCSGVFIVKFKHFTSFGCISSVLTKNLTD